MPIENAYSISCFMTLVLFALPVMIYKIFAVEMSMILTLTFRIIQSQM